MRDFSVNWFDGCAHLFNNYLGDQLSRVLEVGSFEGKSSCWIIDNKLNKEDGIITCVDSWLGGSEHSGIDMGSVKSRFLNNIKGNEGNVEIIENDSYSALLSLQHRTDYYDFIYIDGGHTAKDVITDCILSFPLLKPTGVMAMDDYMWGYGQLPNKEVPKLSIDLFLEAYADQIKILNIGNQVWVEKV